ncbi:MAG TPA: glycosyltransferase family 2 protein [Ignavibacteria bacterium]|nr:glycosyltransferase family 2 protein [Ignavibacteria bacterium]
MIWKEHNAHRYTVNIKFKIIVSLLSNGKILTISIPTWNRSALLKELLDLLAFQIINFNLESKIEILVSDNGSEDDTEKVMTGFSQNHSFVTYNRNKTNIGASGNVLKSMETAEGKFTLFLGDDDRINKNCLSGLITFLEQNPETGLLIDSSNFKKNLFPDSTESLDLVTLLENFYWHIGNAGVTILRSSFAKDNLKTHPYEYFSFSWPQTQLMILGIYQHSNLKIYIRDLNIVSDSVHGEVMMYSSHYLWRAGYYGLYNAIDSIKADLDEKSVNAAKNYLKNNIVQLSFNILQCGVFVDDKEVKRKAVTHISENIHMFSLKEKLFLRMICFTLMLPAPVSKFLSNVFIFLTRGVKGIEKKNDFVKAERLKKAGLTDSNKMIVREFEF